MGRLWSLPAAGDYQLDIVARDSTGSNDEQRLSINIHASVSYRNCIAIIVHLTHKDSDFYFL